VKKPSSPRAPDPLAGVVDRLLAQLPGLQGSPSPARVAPRSPFAAATLATPVREPSLSPREWVGVWARVVLGLSLGVMMASWPYSRTCGLPLFGYLGALLIVMLSGLWAASSSWKHRAGLAHIVALSVVLYGFTLVAAELLPRTGYASDHASWSCQDLVTAPSLVLSQRSS
jgi:hypothetical protein